MEVRMQIICSVRRRLLTWIFILPTPASTSAPEKLKSRSKLCSHTGPNSDSHSNSSYLLEIALLSSLHSIGTLLVSQWLQCIRKVQDTFFYSRTDRNSIAIADWTWTEAKIASGSARHTSRQVPKSSPPIGCPRQRRSRWKSATKSTTKSTSATGSFSINSNGPTMSLGANYAFVWAKL